MGLSELRDLLRERLYRRLRGLPLLLRCLLELGLGALVRALRRRLGLTRLLELSFKLVDLLIVLAGALASRGLEGGTYGSMMTSETGFSCHSAAANTLLFQSAPIYLGFRLLLRVREGLPHLQNLRVLFLVCPARFAQRGAHGLHQVLRLGVLLLG